MSSSIILTCVQIFGFLVTKFLASLHDIRKHLYRRFRNKDWVCRFFKKYSHMRKSRTGTKRDSANLEGSDKLTLADTVPNSCLT